MVSVSQSIYIDVPVDVVFEYLDTPQNHAEVTPSLSTVETLESLDNGGKRVKHTYTMAGVGLDGELVERTHEPNERMVFEMSGGIEGEIEIETHSDGNGTELRYSAEYDLPGSVISRVAAPFVRRYNERELQTTLENTKTRLESAA